MSGLDLGTHVALITVHAAAATGCFVLGILLIASLPAGTAVRVLL